MKLWYFVFISKTSSDKLFTKPLPGSILYYDIIAEEENLSDISRMDPVDIR